MIEVRRKPLPGATWTMSLEKWFSPSGKNASYLIYHQGYQSYTVGRYRSLHAAVAVLDSFGDYV